MRLVFMGTPEFSVPCLRALRAAGHEIAAVYCQPPRASGRGMMERKSPVQLFAEAEGLTVRAPARLKDPAEHDAFAALYPDGRGRLFLGPEATEARFLAEAGSYDLGPKGERIDAAGFDQGPVADHEHPIGAYFR